MKPCRSELGDYALELKGKPVNVVYVIEYSDSFGIFYYCSGYECGTFRINIIGYGLRRCIFDISWSVFYCIWQKKLTLFRVFGHAAIIILSTFSIFVTLIYNEWKHVTSNESVTSLVEYSFKKLNQKQIAYYQQYFFSTESSADDYSLSPVEYRIMYSEYILTGFVDERLEHYLQNGKEFDELLDVLSARFYPAPGRKEIESFNNYYSQRVAVAVNPCGNDARYIMASTTLGKNAEYPRMHRINFHKNQQVSGINQSIETIDNAIDIGPVMIDDYVVRTFGVNSGDVDSDGFGEFIIQDKLYFGSNCDGIKSVDQFNSVNLKGESAFVQTRSGKFILGHDRLRSPQYLILSEIMKDSDERRLKRVAEYTIKKRLGSFITTIGPGRLASYFSIVPLSDLDGDSYPDVAISFTSGVELRFSGTEFSTGMAIDFDSFVPGVFSSVYYQVGGVGDMNGDNFSDFWINFIFGDDRVAVPVSGSKLHAKLEQKEDVVNLSEVSGPMLNFKDYGAGAPDEAPAFLGSTMSSLGGDFDRDGLADFTYTAHYESALSGTLYVVSGDVMARAMNASVPELDVDGMECGVARFRAPLASELAAKPTHISSIDFTGDDVDDIVVGADLDFASYPMNGAVYLLDGAKIGEYLRCE